MYVAATIGVICGLFSFAATHTPGFKQQDFHLWWLAGRALLEHRDPYQVITAVVGNGFVYPLPAAIFAIPFAWLPSSLAGAIFAGASCAILAYVVTQESWWRLLIFLNASAMINVIQGQSLPLLTATLFVPSAMWLGVVKPNIAMGLFASRPGLRPALIAIIILLLSCLVMPSWPREWIESASSSPVHFSPLSMRAGVLLLFVLLKWRRPEARMLAVLAVVPSSPIVYEALPLFTIARNGRELFFLGVASDIAYILTMNLSLEADPTRYLLVGRAAMLWLLYVPCAVIILSRKNEGTVPAPIAALAQRLPRWLRGTPMPAGPSRS